MRRRGGFGLALPVLFVISCVAGGDIVRAHAGLRLTDPLEGATLGDTPAAIRLFFTERPEAALSEIRVVDLQGVAYQTGPLSHTPGDPLSLAIEVRPLPRGVYIVNWRAVSAIDGHATTGAYAFGVRMAPDSTAIETATAAASWAEMIARALLLAGLVLLAGAAAAGALAFGGPADIWLCAIAWALSAIGLACLASAQQRLAAVPFSALMDTAVGRALIWRGLAICAAGVALVFASSAARAASRARQARLTFYRAAMAIVALCALAAMAVHVAAGHAAAGGWLSAPLTIASQWAHFAAAGSWLGGLAALLLGIRGAASPLKAAAIGRFSTLALVSLSLVLFTGVLRTLGALSAWDQLLSTGYGRAVSIKIALSSVIVALGAVNRWRSVPVAAADLAPLRRIARIEVILGVAALVSAAVLGTLAPPAGLFTQPGLKVSGADVATTVRVTLAALADQPGPNRFVVSVRDYDSKQRVGADRVSLNFTPLDDPGVASTTLALAPGPDGDYTGSGSNLAFDGRWRIDVRVERAGSSVDVPLEVDARRPAPVVSVRRVRGQPAEYTAEIRAAGRIRMSVDPERAGRNALSIVCSNTIFEEQPIDVIVVTVAIPDGSVLQQAVRRTGPGRFVADVDLQAGRNRIAVTARTSDGTRLRAMIELVVPRS